MTNAAGGTSSLSGRERYWGLDDAPPEKLDPCEVFPKGEDHDFDACPGFAVSNSKLFSKAAGEAHEIEPNDVQQRQSGDCYLAAPLAALAQSDAGRARLHSMIQENRGPDGSVQSYTVTFKERDTGFLNKIGARETFHDVNVEVTPYFPKGTFEAKDGEIWPCVIEKAFAQWQGGYNETTRGGQEDFSFKALGVKVDRHTPNLLYGASDFVKDVKAGKAITIGTLPGPVGLGLEEKHAYTVVGAFTNEDGETWVKLRNPWGHDDPPPMLFSDLKEYTRVIDVATP